MGNTIATVEIAGGTCAVCGGKVVLAAEGKACPQCGVVLHRACDPHDTCSRCGSAYKVHEPPVADPVGDAVVPRSLRASGPGTTVAVILVAALILILMFGLFILSLMGGH